MLNNLQMILENSKVEASTYALPLVNTVLNDAVFRPMLFSTPMVQALLNGTKTQTRREIKGAIRVERVPQYIEYKHVWDKYMVENSNHEYKLIKPVANIGDIIWVRETHQHTRTLNINPEDENYGYVYKADGQPWADFEGWSWKPSLFMPKDACRLWLKVTNVRVQLLQQITRNDAVNEGIISTKTHSDNEEIFKIYESEMAWTDSPIVSYQSLWQKINGKDSWYKNPFVFVYDFEVTTKRPFGFI